MRDPIEVRGGVDCQSGDRVRGEGNLSDNKDATGKAYGLELYAAAKEGKITEVSYMFPKAGADKTPVAKVSCVTAAGDLGCGVGYINSCGNSKRYIRSEKPRRARGFFFAIRVADFGGGARHEYWKTG